MDVRQVVPASSAGKHHFFINRAFGLLWLGQTISEFGSRITRDGLPIIAVLMLGAMPVQMGILSALGTVPVLFCALLAGIWIDRLPRRPVLIVADLGRALLLLSIPLTAVFAHLHMELLYVVTVLVGILSVFFEIANQSFVPSLLQREQIVEGNSKLEASSSLAEIGGPSLAGLLIQTLTAPLAILFDGLSFLISALCIGMIRAPEQVIVQSKEQQSLWKEVYEGLLLVLRNPLLCALAACTGTRNFFGGAFATLYALYIVRELAMTPAMYGLLITIGGIGGLLGAWATSRMTRRWGMGTMLIGPILLAGSMSLLTPLASGPLILVIVFLALSQLLGDAGGVVYSINELSLRQMIIPERFLGRVNASMRFLVDGVGPLGTLAAGVLSEFIGIRLTLLIGASGLLCSVLWLLHPSIWRLNGLFSK